MFALQRSIALLMAVAFVAFFLVPLALRRHDYALVVLFCALLAAYVGFNLWLLLRNRTRRS